MPGCHRVELAARSIASLARFHLERDGTYRNQTVTLEPSNFVNVKPVKSSL
jgi:hypothetical protein